MAIGSTNSGSGFRIGGRPLGVQLGGKSASSLFGNRDATSIIAANVTATNSSIQVSPNQLALKGIQDEIDRTLGYRTNLSVAEKQKLADYQGKIEGFNEIAQARALTSDEIEERSDLYVEAYRLLGKDYVDVASDPVLKAKTNELTELMKTKPKGADLKRLEVLEKLKDNMLNRVNEGTEGTAEIYFKPLRNVTRQINNLTAARDITQLSPEEIRRHDEIADEINSRAGQELQLPSEKRFKIARLQQTMRAIEEGGGGGGVSILA